MAAIAERRADRKARADADSGRLSAENVRDDDNAILLLWRARRRAENLFLDAWPAVEPQSPRRSRRWFVYQRDRVDDVPVPVPFLLYELRQADPSGRSVRWRLERVCSLRLPHLGTAQFRELGERPDQEHVERSRRGTVLSRFVCIPVLGLVSGRRWASGQTSRRIAVIADPDPDANSTRRFRLLPLRHSLRVDFTKSLGALLGTVPRQARRRSRVDPRRNRRWGRTRERVFRRDRDARIDQSCTTVPGRVQESSGQDSSRHGGWERERRPRSARSREGSCSKVGGVSLYNLLELLAAYSETPRSSP